MSNRKLISFAQRNAFVSSVINGIGRSRAQNVLAQFRPWLPERGRVLDIGAGTAHVAEAVRTAGYETVACDLTDLRFVTEPLVLANGTHLPFAAGSFDISLLSTVLHHAPSDFHADMLREGARVLRTGGRLLVLEDIYVNTFEMVVTRVVDAISNGQLFGEPHSNRTLPDWTRMIDELGLKLVHTEQFFAWFGFLRIRQALIVIQRR